MTARAAAAIPASAASCAALSVGTAPFVALRDQAAQVLADLEEEGVLRSGPNLFSVAVETLATEDEQQDRLGAGSFRRRLTATKGAVGERAGFGVLAGIISTRRSWAVSDCAAGSGT